ncbi:hypothetical protein ASF24_22690 [Methylobacterium sp. Leaf86]|nr:hypothetical protein ASF24_22690 [Methylobacterium sp. Leaf86]
MKRRLAASGPRSCSLAWAALNLAGCRLPQMQLDYFVGSAAQIPDCLDLVEGVRKASRQPQIGACKLDRAFLIVEFPT